MDAIPLTRASQIIQIARRLEEHGGSAERIMARARLPMWHLAQPDQLIPTRHIWLFMERAAQTTGGPAFGHVIGDVDPVRSLGALGMRLSRSSTLYEALRTCCHQISLHTSNVRCWLIEANDHIWFCCGAFVIADVGLAEMEQCMLMQMIRIVRLGAGPVWRPTEVRLQTGPVPGLEESNALAEANIRYGEPATAIAVPRSILPFPVGGDARPASPTQYRTPAPANDLTGSIRQLVSSWISEAYPGIEVVAEAAGLNVRALQRRLAREGVTYSEVVEQVRFQTAARSLEDADAKVTDIAFDLGYSDVAHFSRAFHRWAGVSPRAYRRLSVSH